MQMLWLLTAFTVADADGLNFLVMGDWGGSGSRPFTTGGEISVADAMGKLAPTSQSNFALALGDNFYSTGITTDENDQRFKSTFEDVFTADSLKGDSFFRVVAGNHDHYGNVTAQVAYSSHSKRWHFPSLYYSFTEAIPAAGPEDADSSVQIVLIDTVLLSGQAADPVTGEHLPGSNYTGPADQQAADDQWAWLEGELAKSTADYLIVAGHYPVYSICEHGPTAVLVSKLKPMMEKYKVTAYLAGHDHCAEHINEGKPGSVDYHGIGASHSLAPPPPTLQPSPPAL
jgi:3',5'-cyclic AMP phosphodiesterase CpdA